jgi:hypothetical protein
LRQAAAVAASMGRIQCCCMHETHIMSTWGAHYVGHVQGRAQGVRWQWRYCGLDGSRQAALAVLAHTIWCGHAHEAHTMSEKLAQGVWA